VQDHQEATHCNSTQMQEICVPEQLLPGHHHSLESPTYTSIRATNHGGFLAGADETTLQPTGDIASFYQFLRRCK